MRSEFFDVVNDRDEVIGAECRAVVHRFGLRHRAVHVQVFNQAGAVFLQKRSKIKDSAPRKWDSSASGHLHQGEHYDSCAIRELREELGVVASHSPERLLKLGASANTGWEFVWIYRCRAEGPFILPPVEIEKGAWFLPNDVSHRLAIRPLDFASSFVSVWHSLLQLKLLPFPA